MIEEPPDSDKIELEPNPYQPTPKTTRAGPRKEDKTTRIIKRRTHKKTHRRIRPRGGRK